MQLFLSCFNYSIEIQGHEEQIIKKLHKEFFYFAKDSLSKSDYKIEIKLELAPTLPRLVAKKITETSIIYETSHKKYVQYEQTLVIQDKRSQCTIIYSQNLDEAYEVAFLLIHSLIGKNLDLDGLHRVHAVGINYKNQNALIMLPSKGGKSTLLSKLLSDGKVNIISDDMPIIDNLGRVHNFPSKISVQSIPEEGFLSEIVWEKFHRTIYPPKYTASLASLRDRIAKRHEAEPVYLIAGFRTTNEEGYLEEVSKLRMIPPLFEHMIFGVGLPQVVEYFLTYSWKDYLILPLIALKRMWAAYKLLTRSKTYYFFLGTQKDLNAEKILKLLNENAQ